mmetsp:Transcript_51147/g.91894  ORF Transcript_51147/g.91894 Transcript_51147/m.91894 type:complete len:239 (-) Transcript_51147:28-744(-)|eukprot:CAMPEP_0197651812 /NCGR_PEP_ID=MMETSP1338-20131121/34066_1 /TAXON_ID=43686 ORGANISM="Pelagodinium beii, Strain RCC1491" /NCGR_SAMPLE_ID=MMETSP1338 /ASSEMBLY_ACC=CAM_ASM_000754 /LENGTH=238 /DNA_ID=CAMNT_0043226551 /DNA_START=77 /DNA_END=796 /DNA_ORIENTATION=-
MASEADASRPNTVDGSGSKVSATSSGQKEAVVSGEAEDPEHPKETMDEILALLDAQQDALWKQHRKADMKKLSATRKQLAAKQLAAQGAKTYFAPPPPFKRPSDTPQIMDGFKRLPVKYLEAKHAAIMDRPDRVKLYSSKEYPPFLHGDTVPRTFDDKRVLNLVKAKDPDTKLSQMHFLSEATGKHVPEEPSRAPAQMTGPTWKPVSSTPRELNVSRPLLERAGRVALLASEGPITAR